MELETRELVHPTQAGRVRLRIYAADAGGFLATEEREGATIVISTLGLFETREAAEVLVAERVAELERQRYKAA